MNVITDPRLAGERLLTFVRENRLVQGSWRREEGGREFACHLGAAAGIKNSEDCPASLMPKWVARALPALFDGQTEAHAIAFAIRWGEAMVRDEWRRIDWDEVRREWLAFIVKQAQDAAAAANAASAHAANAAYYAASAHAANAAYYAARAAAAAADAARAAAADAAADAAARDAQADALMEAIERAMEVARG